jgi:hypothetical protein
LASLARRLGSLAVPLTVIPVLLHREHLIPSDIFLIAALLAALVAAVAVCAALLALVRLWFTGDKGWGLAISGMLLGAICLLPVAYFSMLAAKYPAATDVTTTSRGLMPLVLEPDTTRMPPPKTLSAAQLEAVFPNVKTRTYPLDAQQIYGIVLRMVTERGWDIRLTQPPTTPTGTGRINARDVTLFGWREEVVLLISGTAEGASVDMRSASINALHDFGSNGDRIEDFLIALDTEITALLRDNPNADQPVEAADDPTPADQDAPAPGDEPEPPAAIDNAPDEIVSPG